MSRETVKALTQTMQSAYKAADVRLIRRTSALLALSQGEPVESVAGRQAVAESSVYNWLKLFVLQGVAGLRVQWKGGRPSKLTATQKARLVELVKAGPEAAGFTCGCWNTLLIQLLIEREFGVLYNAHYVAELLGNLGFSFQKARFLAEHLDAALAHRVEPGGQRQQRALAGPGGTGDGQRAGGRNPQADVVHRPHGFIRARIDAADMVEKDGDRCTH